MIYYTADLHFGHENVIKMDHRPFSGIEEMDETLIKNWNRRVTDNDEIYIVGDFCYKARHPAEWYLQQLHGRKHLIIGNHDSKLLKNPVAVGYFETVRQMASINDDEHWVILCHYPLAEWPGSRRHSCHVHGHIHNNRNRAYYNMKREDRAFNAGCMLNHYTPVTLQELVENKKVTGNEKTRRWYYEAVRSYLILNCALDPDEVDQILDRYELLHRLELFPDIYLHDPIESTVQDMEEKGYLQEGCDE